MFGPQASPVVQAHSTWHIGPTTCVSTSRSFACFDIDGSSWRSASQRRISATCASRNRAERTASSVEPQTKHDARVIRSPSTYVRKPPDSAAARAPRYSETESPPSVCASGTKTSSAARPVSDELGRTAPPARTRRARARAGRRPTTGITAAPVSISCACDERLEVDARSRRRRVASASWRALDRVGVVLPRPALHLHVRAYAAPDRISSHTWRRTS